MLEDDLYIADRKINESSIEAKKYINLRNGLFNLETFQLEPHRPDLFFTTQLDFAYDPDADDPTFRSYLNRSLVLPEDHSKTDHTLVMLVHQALAYSMTSRTDMKASFWLVGKPDSGKSTFIALIRSLMGNLHSTIDLNQLAANRFLLSEIVGKRVVTFTEANSNTVLPDALYKAMVGGEDEVYADVKNKPGIAFKPEAKFWWAMNESPRVADRSDAVFNRLVIIPFNRSIPKADRVHNLVELLAAEKPGIFNTLMNAYRRMTRQGHFEHCEQSINLRKHYQMENDTEATFLQEETEVAPRARIQSINLYTLYRGWCERNGFRPKNANQVAKDWERLGLVKSMSDGRAYWYGRKVSDDSAVQ